MVDGWLSGPAGRGRLLGHRLTELSAALFAEPNPVVIKATLYAQGRIPSPVVRLPLLEASPGAAAAALHEASCVTAGAAALHEANRVTAGAAAPREASPVTAGAAAPFA